jgi:hypothetical protein
METKICQNCADEFILEVDDLYFYEKIKVPKALLCRDCKMIRKYLWRNERTLYRRNCDKTGKSLVSIYAPDSPFSVYSVSEWWSDSWDPKIYALEYDFTRSFFEQFQELQKRVPRLALLNKNCQNSDYSNHSSNSKDVYMSCTAFDSENIMHSSNTVPAKNSSDVYRTEGKSNENLFECINVHDCYNCQYCFLIENSFDCYYSFDLKNCSNCFLSYNLRGQSYVFMNQKYSKEEYFEKVNKFNLKSHIVREKLYQEWLEIIFSKALHRASLIENSINCLGNFIFNSKNASNCFDIEDLEDCKDVDFSIKLKDSRSCYHIGIQTELMYECHGIVRSSGCKFVHLSYDNTNLTYCDSCHNSNELFGCVGIKKGAYMIFNKQYSKEEYFELKEKIIAQMIQNNEYGEFFPANLSPFAYNETQAQVYFPKTREEALKEGYKWKDDLPGTFGKEDIKLADLSDSIDDIDESIIGKILVCARTGRNFNITNQEYIFLKSHNIPIPRLHPNERYLDRIKLRPKRKLYKTYCSVSGVELLTSYPPEHRPKNIVSDEVYKKSIY